MSQLTDISSQLGTVALVAVVLWALYTALNRKFIQRLPPGPMPLPIIGNAHQVPPEDLEKTLQAWGRTFGDVSYARIFQTNVVVLNSAQSAYDLLNKRSGNYSDRPPFTTQSEFMGYGQALTHIPYGPRYRRVRKWAHDAFLTPSSLKKYHPIQRREAYVVLTGLIENPEDFMSHFTRFTTAEITEITYGHTISGLDDEYIRVAEKATAATVELGTQLVDFVPSLRYYPTWLPFSGWKRQALEAGKLVKVMFDYPYNKVKKAMAEGNATPSFAASLLEECYRKGSLTQTDEEDIKYTAGVLYGAGSETTATVLHAFLLAMVRYPRVFKKAQEEIDRVIGPDRLPDIDDRDSLPYINWIVKETYRWHTPTTLGVPHASVKDDEFRGYFIPGKSIVLNNIWGMCQDSEVYPNPDEFWPERFEGMSQGEADRTDPKNIVFGFGRRQCPGLQFADTGIYLVAANIIATMDVSKAKDENGIEITPPVAFKTGFVRHILPFKCSIRPRSQKVVELVAQVRAASNVKL